MSMCLCNKQLINKEVMSLNRYKERHMGECERGKGKGNDIITFHSHKMIERILKNHHSISLFKHNILNLCSRNTEIA